MKFIKTFFQNIIYAIKHKYRTFKLNRGMRYVLTNNDTRNQLKRDIQLAQDKEMMKCGLNPKSYLPL